MALYEYLQVAGIKLDCYFTIEGTPREGESGWIAVCDAKWDMSVSSIDKLTAEVAAKVPGVKVFRSDDNPAVVHVMDKRLAGMADYVLAKKTSITFKGKAQALVDRLHEKCFEELETRTAFLGGGWPPARPPDSTPIVCSARQAAVRRILSDYLPLSQYGRILWLAESRSEDDKLRTTIQYLGGDSYDGPIRLCTAPSDGLAQPAIDFRTGTPMVNGVIPFDYGEIAYRNNPDPDKEELTVNLNDEAIQFINERLDADRPLQVRWAMFYLGKRKAKEGIPVLLKHLDYQYTTCGVLEESYPAVQALTMIGEPAAAATFKELTDKGATDLRVRLLSRVLRNVKGVDAAYKDVKKALDGATDDKQKRRLELALRFLNEEE